MKENSKEKRGSPVTPHLWNNWMGVWSRIDAFIKAHERSNPEQAEGIALYLLVNSDHIQSIDSFIKDPALLNEKDKEKLRKLKTLEQKAGDIITDLREQTKTFQITDTSSRESYPDGPFIKSFSIPPSSKNKILDSIKKLEVICMEARDILTLEVEKY